MNTLFVITKFKVLFFRWVSRLTLCNSQLVAHDLSLIQSNIIITKDTASWTNRLFVHLTISFLKLVCVALIDGKQIAIFRTKQNDLFALDNYDPFSQANVLSRGLIGGTTVTDDTGTAKEVLYVASPIYKQRFNLATGQCLDDESVMLDAYQVVLNDNNVMIARV